MGAKFGKTKKLILSENICGEKKDLNSVLNHHANGTATLDRKIEKKQGKYSKQKSLDLRVDKCTTTEVNLPVSSSSTTCIKRLVTTSSSNNHSNTPSKDILEFRDALIRRGIISSDAYLGNLPVPNEEKQETKPDEIVKESLANEITNTEEQQQQSEEKETITEEQQVES